MYINSVNFNQCTVSTVEKHWAYVSDLELFCPRTLRMMRSSRREQAGNETDRTR